MRSALLLLGTLLAFGRPGLAQQPRTAAMKSALRDLVTAQERYFVDHGTYTTDVVALGAQTPGRPRTDSLWIQVLFAGGRSWTGRAVHQGQRGKSCVIFVGFVSDFPTPPVTERDSLRAMGEGEPVCDAT